MEPNELIVCRDASLGYEGQSVLAHLDLTFVSGQGVHTVCIGFYHVQPVGYFDVFQHFFSFIETSVVVLIHKNTPVVGGSSRKRSCQ